LLKCGSKYKKTADVWTFVIITAAANESVLPFHDRMPLILTADEIKNWILDTSYTNEYLMRPVKPNLTSMVRNE
jgi:putative SOS response-associated peptidase YedK